jgi:hypothetical protein
MKQWQRWWVWLLTVFIFQIFFVLPGWNLDYDSQMRTPLLCRSNDPAQLICFPVNL